MGCWDGVYIACGREAVSLFLYQSRTLQPVGLNDKRLKQIEDAQKHHPCYHPCQEDGEKLVGLVGLPYHFFIIPVTTPSRRMPKSYMDLQFIFASSLLPPMPAGCLEVSGTCNSFLHIFLLSPPPASSLLQSWHLSIYHRQLQRGRPDKNEQIGQFAAICIHTHTKKSPMGHAPRPPNLKFW